MMLLIKYPDYNALVRCDTAGFSFYPETSSGEKRNKNKNNNYAHVH